MQIGTGKEGWPTAILKELIDNSLDACEAAGSAPEIEIMVGEDGLTVRDSPEDCWDEAVVSMAEENEGK